MHGEKFLIFQYFLEFFSGACIFVERRFKRQRQTNSELPSIKGQVFFAHIAYTQRKTVIKFRERSITDKRFWGSFFFFFVLLILCLKFYSIIYVEFD